MVRAPDIAHAYLKANDPIPVEWKDRLIMKARPTYAKSGQIIISQGSSSSDVYYIAKGQVLFSLIAGNGRETILRELGEGHIFGELSAIDMQPRSVNVLAIEDCEFAQLPATAFRSFLLEEPTAGFWLLQQLARRTRNLTDRLFELATLSVSSRLQSELLSMAVAKHKAGDMAIIEPLPTHASLAARIGTHREAVTRELRSLCEEGIIKQSGRKLTVLSVERLQDLVSKVR